MQRLGRSSVVDLWSICCCSARQLILKQSEKGHWGKKKIMSLTNIAFLEESLESQPTMLPSALFPSSSSLLTSSSPPGSSSSTGVKWGTISPTPEQVRCVEAVSNALQRGRDVFFQAPTGSGKTHIAAELANRVTSGSLDLVAKKTTKRNEKPEQTRKRLKTSTGLLSDILVANPPSNTPPTNPLLEPTAPRPHHPVGYTSRTHNQLEAAARVFSARGLSSVVRAGLKKCCLVNSVATARDPHEACAAMSAEGGGGPGDLEDVLNSVCLYKKKQVFPVGIFPMRVGVAELKEAGKREKVCPFYGRGVCCCCCFVFVDQHPTLTPRKKF